MDEFWERKTAQEDFILQSGEMVPVQMMRESRGESFYINGDNFKAVTKQMHYGTMRFVLPDEGVTVDDILSDPKLLAFAMESKDWERAKIDFALPRFNFGSSYDLMDMFEQLGLSALSDAAAGVLNPIADNPDGNLYVSQVIQETFIAVDENGVEASAYTVIDINEGVGLPEALPYIEVILNRPFLYGIFADNGTLLFVGVVRNPNIE